MTTKDQGNLEIVNDKRSTEFFKVFAELRELKRFTDIKLQIGDVELDVHRAVLSAASPSFNAMFDDAFIKSGKDKVELLHETNPTVMSAILDYMYLGKLNVALKDVRLLLQNLDYLQMENAKKECERALLDNVNQNNSIEILILADKYGLTELYGLSSQSLKQNFHKIYESNRIKELPVDELEIVLKAVYDSHPKHAFKSILSWIEQDAVQRCPHMYDLSSKYIKVGTLTKEIADQKLFIFPDRSPKVHVVELKSKKLSVISRPPKCKQFSAATYKNGLYAVGGSSSKTLREFGFKYDFECRKWSQFPCLVLRRKPGVCVADDKLYIVGGYDKEFTAYSTVSCYDFQTGQLHNLSSMKEHRASPGVIYYNSSIYVFGGDDPRGGIVERYDPREGVWTQAGKDPDRDMGCTAALVFDKIYYKHWEHSLYTYEPRQLTSRLEQKYSKFGTIASCDNRLYIALDEGGISHYIPETNNYSKVSKKKFVFPFIVSYKE